MLTPVAVAMVATIWATASSVLFPVISPNAVFMFTVTMLFCGGTTESTSTSLGMAVVMPCTVSEADGPSSMALRMASSGAGAAT